MNYKMIRRSADELRRLKHSHQLRAMMKRRERHALPFSLMIPSVDGTSAPCARRNGTGKSGEEARS